MPALIDAFSQGTHAGRPAAISSNAGYYYLETDTDGGTLFQSDGSTWVQLAAAVAGPSSAQTIYSVSATFTIPAAHSLTLATAHAFTITLPDATLCIGQQLEVNLTIGGGTVTVAAQSGQTVQGSSTLTLNVGGFTLISDGANWWAVGSY